MPPKQKPAKAPAPELNPALVVAAVVALLVVVGAIAWYTLRGPDTRPTPAIAEQNKALENPLNMGKAGDSAAPGGAMSSPDLMGKQGDK